MFTLKRILRATPEQVWDVLSDGWLFPVWVVGATSMRAVDPKWPQVGARLHHAIGAWPLVVADTTSVVSCEPNRLLELEARTGLAGAARVIMRLRSLGDGRTEVTMQEDASQGALRFVPRPMRRVLVVPRNRECLQRLARLAEGRASNA